MNQPFRHRILNVDDNAAGRYARSRMLQQAGFEIIEAGTGAEALHAVAIAKPDVILLDVHLPDMNGIEVCKLIKADSASSGVLIIQVSATSIRSTDMQRGLEGGADGYLVEPIEPEVLIATIRAFLRLRQTEEALRSSEERFRRTFEGAPIGMTLFTRTYRLIEANRSLAEMLGYCSADLARLGLMDLIHPDDWETLKDLQEQLFLAQIPSYVKEKRCIGGDGEVVWVRLTATTIQSSTGEVLGLAMVENVTERKRSDNDRAALLAAERRARSQAETASRSKDQFLATVSHELRTPLNAILGWARMLRTAELDAPTTAQALETIERNAQAQAQLIGDLLDVSRIISGKLRLDVRLVHLPPLIEAALETVKPAAEAKQISFQTSFEEVGLVPADPDRLQQVVWNLLSNAIKFTPEGGSVKIWLRSTDSRVELKVVDTGIGIDPLFVPFVFDRFRQADSSSGRVYGGLGLGLAIVRHLVELHGGSVDVQSTGPGMGSTFTIKLLKTISLPSEAGSDDQDSSPPMSSAAAKPIPRRSLERVSVLAVDDDPDARELLIFILEQSGATVRVAPSAAEALEILNSWKPTILLADIGLPGLDGYEFIRKIRAYDPPSALPLPAIALTAYAGPKDRAEALRAGFQEHLIKPVEPSDLIAVIATLVKRSLSVPG